ncbi:MAG: DASS family sodium-coupled anion symporter [Planctomycetes bacterium]|nr:DASS family sodium-coupled anion symporter [Planctomycetota bacterium]
MTEDTGFTSVRPRALLVGLALAVSSGWLATLLPFPEPEQAARGARAMAATVFTTTCWLTGAMPLAPASLLPLALFPLLGVQSTGAAAAGYSDPILWMFFGGFVLAMAIERCGLHRRLALRVIALLGLDPRRLVLGFFAAATLVSMWINNTAVTLMLLPIGAALVQRVQGEALLPEREARSFGVCVLLAIAYGSSIGGVATPIGTAPNLLFYRNYQPYVDRGAPPFSFLDWMAAFVPFALGFMVLAWLVLARLLHRLGDAEPAVAQRLRAELRALPPMDSAERRVAWLFAGAVLLWITRADLRLGPGLHVAGWVSWIGLREQDVLDGSIAVLVAILAFVIPSGRAPRERLMDWSTARQMPFEILFLLGGGVAIANAFEATGLSAAVGQAAAPTLASVPPFVAVALTCVGLTLLTEVASNTAITALMLPLLAATASTAGMDPRLLMLPATIAASCGFALPIGTPPNTVVFATGRLRMSDMVRAGILLDVLSAVILSLVFWFWALPVLGIDPQQRPGWVR